MRCHILLLIFGIICPGCDRTPSVDPENTLTLAAGGTTLELAQLEESLAKYEKLNPPIKIHLLRLPPSSSQQHDVFITYLASKDSTIDILNLDAVWTSEFAAAGWLCPLDQFWSTEDQKDFISAALQSVSYQSKRFAVPWFTSCGLLYYRKDILERYGLNVPRNFLDMKNIYQSISSFEVSRSDKKKWTGFVWQGAQYEGLICNYYEALWSAGSPSKALRRMKEAISSGLSPQSVLSYKEEDARRAFASGNVLFMRNWPYAWASFNQADSPLRGKIGITKLLWNNGDSPGMSCLGGWNLAIGRFSQHPQKAWELIHFLTSVNEMGLKCQATGELPPRRTLLYDTTLWKNQPYWKDIVRILESARARPQTPFYAEWSLMIQLQISQFLVSDRAGLEEILKKMKEKWKELKELEEPSHDR